MRYTIAGKTGEWEVVIGLEVHCQVITNSKLFSGASAVFGSEQNSSVSTIDAGYPGMLPVINKFAVEQTVRTGMAINATINKYSAFDRKNYFYADLPTGYQISQFFKPIVTDGYLDINRDNGEVKRIGIERIHIEQDAGKSVHDLIPAKSCIDLNRAGVTLMELVTRPELESPEDAGKFVRKLRSIVRYLGTCDGNMDEGSMRCDVNVSVNRPGEGFGTRVEVKNVNSIRFVIQAVEIEAKRQIAAYEAGEPVIQETRLFDDQKLETRAMRTKEFAIDYRYFPDPDLVHLVLDDEMLERVKATMPELPEAKKERFMSEYGLPAYDADILVSEKEIAFFFETAAKGHDAKKVSNWVIGDLFALLNTLGKDITESPISAENLGKLVGLIEDNTISGKIAKEVFALMAEDGKAPEVIVEEKGLKQVTDTGAIAAEVDKVIASNPDKVAEYKAGKDKLLGWFVGQVMAATKGKANPAMLNEMLKNKLS
ncbi:MAG: Asp-tRNA(Asn)/Glu-tRNA(Gln) amidotransferase subunit GatB [Alphaproteobacteria bacterium]|nr:Asp-tRNA(Asn)/Glu-tRNA(Gln) amidotransferase subunit GatB [Alphaproteobacteria bacterium]